MASAKLLFLQYPARGWRTDSGLHAFCAMANHDVQAFGPECEGCVDDVLEQGLPGQRVQNLG
jgi:hypothetical protein